MSTPIPRTTWADGAKHFGVNALAWIGFPRLQRRSELRAAWGMPGDSDAWLASKYFDLTRVNAPTSVVDDRTWADLEFPRFFSGLDTTISPVGRQYLYRQLRTYEFSPEAIAERYRSYDTLRGNAKLREEIQLTLTSLDGIASAHIAEVLLGPPLKLPKNHSLIAPWAVVSVLAVIGAFMHLVPLWLCASILVFNVLVAWIAHPKLNRNADALASCGRLLGVATRLASIRAEDGVLSLTKLMGSESKHRKLASQIRVLGLLGGLRNTVLGGFVALLNGCFLLKVLVYTQSIRNFMLYRPQWLSVFDLVGDIDASVAIANFLHRHPGHCRPIVSTEPLISIENGYHPLLREPVANSLSLMNRSALVTGSNMAGKTTFIKMVAINIILGHTLGICLAARATIPRSAAMALIRGEQSVESGKSRYFAEVEVIRDFIDRSSTGATRVFLLDEPFSGTNTAERIGASRAVLDAIAAHAQVLVTTHDVELQHLLGSCFELFHFQEDPAIEGFFDYRLRTGAGTQRNAIKVLERLGFPKEIIEKALATIQSLET